MELTALFAGHYGLLLAWLFFSFLLGAGLHSALARLPGSAPAEMPNFELAIFFHCVGGLAVQILALIVIASLGWLSETPLAITALVLLGAALYSLRTDTQDWHANLGLDSPRPGWLGGLSLIFLLAVPALQPFGPPMRHDSISYHLPYARFYLQSGGLAVDEYLRFPLHSHNFNLLYSVALLKSSIAMPTLVHASAGGLTLLGTWGLVRHWAGLPWAVVGAASLYLFGEFSRAFGAAFVDLGLMLFMTASFLALAQWHSQRARIWLLIAAIALGSAMGTKYYALVFTVPLGLYVLWRDRRLSTLLMFTAVSCAVGLFWYVRSYLISGNPVHPFASEWFGFYIWSAQDVADQVNELGGHGVDRTLLNFIRLPWLLSNNEHSFSGYLGDSSLLLGAFFVSLFGIWRYASALRWLAMAALAFVVFWFSTSQVIRYMLPVVPLMAITISCGLRHLWQSLWARLPSSVTAMADKQPKLASNAVSLLALLAVGSQSIDKLKDELKYWKFLPKEQALYLTEHRKGYALMKAAANDPRIGDGPVLQILMESATYFFPGRVYGDWMGHYGYSDFIALTPKGQRLLPPQRMHEKLAEHGFRALILAKGHPWTKDINATWAPWFELVFEDDYGRLIIPRPLDQSGRTANRPLPSKATDKPPSR